MFIEQQKKHSKSLILGPGAQRTFQLSIQFYSLMSCPG